MKYLVLFFIVNFQTVLLFMNFNILEKESIFNKDKLLSLFLVAFLFCPFGMLLGSYSAILMVLFLFFSIHNKNQNTVIENLGILSFGLIIALVSDHIAYFFVLIFLRDKDSIIFSVAQLMITFLFSIMISIGISSIVSYVKNKLNIEREYFFSVYICGTITAFIYYVDIISEQLLGNSTEIILINFIFFSIFIVVFIICICFFLFSIKKQYDLKRKEQEYLNNLRYIEMIEKQYSELRIFRHDYKNILQSIEVYINDNDIDGLKDYYYRIQSYSNQIDQNNSKISGLSNIKIREIKGIIASKVLTAQEKGYNTHVEVLEEIKEENLQSLILVRILGIFLDNSIEELDHLKNGMLSVAIFEDSVSVHFIIQNSCRADLPKLFELKKKGFSTKGRGRGEGLSIVSEIVKKNESLQLQTVIDNSDCKFTQLLTVNK